MRNYLLMNFRQVYKVSRVWAEAFSKRNVPQYVLGGSGSGKGDSIGNDAQVTQQMINAMLIKQLAIDPMTKK